MKFCAIIVVLLIAIAGGAVLGGAILLLLNLVRFVFPELPYFSFLQCCVIGWATSIVYGFIVKNN